MFYVLILTFHNNFKNPGLTSNIIPSRFILSNIISIESLKSFEYLVRNCWTSISGCIEKREINVSFTDFESIMGVTVVTVVGGVAEIQEIIPNDQSDALRIQRNNRNTETQIMDSKQVKDTLISLFSMQPEIDVQQFLTRYPEDFRASIDIMLDNMKRDGMIFEVRPGFIKLL